MKQMTGKLPENEFENPDGSSEQAAVFIWEDAPRFLDEVFRSKGHKRGFKNVKEWIEKLIEAEDLIEKNPAGALQFLARSYGIELCSPQNSNNELLAFCVEAIGNLINEVRFLRADFTAKVQSDNKILAKAKEAKTAKDAAFAVKGHRNGGDDSGKLTTREMLERQFAALDY